MLYCIVVTPDMFFRGLFIASKSENLFENHAWHFKWLDAIGHRLYPAWYSDLRISPLFCGNPSPLQWNTVTQAWGESIMVQEILRTLRFLQYLKGDQYFICYSIHHS
jgi:hypothetical protein